MVRVDKSRINDILIDGKPASAMYNRYGGVVWEKVDANLALNGNRDRNVTLETVVPKWCNYIEYILVAGGGGGEAGSGSDGQDGRPADAGEESTGSYIIPDYLDRDTHDIRIQAVAGKGGVGGQSGGGTGRHGAMGNQSMIYVFHGDVVNPYEALLYSHKVDGGLGGPASNRPRGGTSGGRLALSAPRYLYIAAQTGVGENYHPSDHWYGVGGGGGSGGIFNRYTKGGPGAGGCVLIGFGGSPEPREKVTITLGSYNEASNQLQAALSSRGFNYKTVELIPFDIELVGTGSVEYMFINFASLKTVPELDTSQVTDMRGMFYGCSSLSYVPDMNTSQVTDAGYMFSDCAALTDGNVRLIGKHPNVNTMSMTISSGLTRQPFYDAAGNPI